MQLAAFFKRLFLPLLLQKDFPLNSNIKEGGISFCSVSLRNVYSLLEHRCTVLFLKGKFCKCNFNRQLIATCMLKPVQVRWHRSSLLAICGLCPPSPRQNFTSSSVVIEFRLCCLIYLFTYLFFQDKSDPRTMRGVKDVCTYTRLFQNRTV